MESDVDRHLAMDLRAEQLTRICFPASKPIEEHDGDHDEDDD